MGNRDDYLCGVKKIQQIVRHTKYVCRNCQLIYGTYKEAAKCCQKEKTPYDKAAEGFDAAYQKITGGKFNRSLR